MRNRTVIEFEMSTDGGQTWKHFDTIRGYDDAAAEFSATCNGDPDEIAESLSDGNTVEGMSVFSGRRVRAWAVQS